jgi:uncharacterized coiled-coil protein SlyX
MDRKDLKIQALLEKLSQVSTQKENEIADLRVELTIVSQELNELRAEKEGENAEEESPALTDDKD